MRTNHEYLVRCLAKGGTSMQRAMKTVLPAVLALMALAAGCAQDLGTVDRVQQNVTKKADLLFNPDGTRKEWFIQTTTVEAPYASAYAFVGLQGSMDRGVFDIQEKVLYFYRVYTFMTDEWAGNPRSDVDQRLLNRDGTPYLVNGQEVWIDKNAPVAAYTIDSHLDVIWEYNPNTGEETNVLVENTTDRLWHERESMRVAWGNDLLPSAVNGFGYFGAGSSRPNILHDAQSTPELQSRITPATGYMDFVNDWIYQAQTEYLDGYGMVPLCYFYSWYTGGTFECISERIRTRTSFLQVDPVREATFYKYDRQDFNDHDMQRFGYFRSERLRWDIDYGTTYGGVQRYINRHDIWQRNAETGDIVGVKPIVYHLTEGYPTNLVQEGIDQAAQWSVAFDATVRSVTGKDPAELPAFDRFGKPLLNEDGSALTVEHMYIICENNETDLATRGDVKAETNPLLCGDLKEAKHLGDLRYNFLSAVTAPTQVGLYGYGPSSADPLSGRIVSATANNYVAAMREGARQAIDRIELLTGVKSFREIADAKYIADDMRNARLKQSTYWKSGFTNDQAKELAKKLVAPEVATSLTATLPEKTDQNFSASRMAILGNNPDLESMFVNDDVRMLFKDPRLGEKAPQVLDTRTEKYLLKNWANATGSKKMIEYYMGMSRRGYDLASFFDGAVLHLADEYKARYDSEVCRNLGERGDMSLDFGEFNDGNPCTTEALIEQLRTRFAYANALSPYGFEVNYFPSPLEMATNDPGLRVTQEAFQGVLEGLRDTFLDEIYQRIYYGVAIHEVGHTLGLRHNFEASSDALNFKPGYWDLKVRKDGDTYEPVGLWGETPEQVAAGLREYQYSSVMDYYMKFNMPWMGIGLYDTAAIKYGYGNLLEVFDTPPDLTPVKDYVAIDPIAISPGNESAALKERGEGLGLALRRVHATNIPNLWDDLSGIYARHDVHRSQVLGDPCTSEGAACDDNKVCKKFYEGLRCSIEDTVVPYRFGSDELSYRLPTVATFDEGVDSFEIVNSMKEYYENLWIFSGYWHQNPTYWPTNYDGSMRFAFYNMRHHFQWWVLNYQTYNHDDFWQQKFGMRWEEDLNGGLPGALAAYTSFNTMAGAFGRPEPGVYGHNWQTDRFEPLDEVNRNNYTTQITLLEEAGARPIYSAWDYSGYSPVVVSSGSIYERIAAFQYLSDPETWFLATDYQADTRKYLISFASVFRTEMRELFGGLMANNSEKYGWCILTHPQSQQPLTFVQPDRVGSRFAGQDCATMFSGCFAKVTATSYSKTPSRLIRYDDTATQCPRDEEKLALPGKSLEPEPLYTFPTTRFRIPMLAAYYGMSLMVSNYDQSFMDTTRMWLQGDRYAITPPPGAEIATCEDIFSGRVYTTFRQPGEQYYPAFDLVKQCDFMFGCYDPSRNQNLSDDDVDTCKSIAQSLKEIPELTFDDLRANYLFHPLQFLVGKLELIRAMHASFEYGETSPTASGY